jgi:dihydrolipoamide dehydrogenase
MVVGDIPDPADLLIVGGGPGGYAAAIAAAQSGRSVTLVDRDEWAGLGGTCLQVGCIPSKALIELAQRAFDLGETPGLTAVEASVDLVAFQRHRRAIVAKLAEGVGGLMRHYGIETVTGQLRFTGARRAVVTTTDRPKHIEFNDALLAVGASPVELRGVPFDGERVFDSAGVLALAELPESACIVGGGYIGLELGTALAKLGARVTIVEAADRIAIGFDEEIARVVMRSLERLGVTVLTGATVDGLDPTHAIVTTAGGEQMPVEAERIAICIGRHPNTASLGLEHLGVQLASSGHVIVDDSGIAAPHVAAIGDAVDGPALAHKATAEARPAVDALAGRRASREFRALPLVMFTDPEVAATGLTAPAAEADGIDAGIATVPFAALGRAATIAHTNGFVRVVFDRGDGEIVGAQIVGPHASELIAEATLAIEMGTTIEDLALTVHAHPTLAEGLSEAAELAAGHPLHVPLREASKRLLATDRD